MNLQDLSIIVVDDDKDILGLLARMLAGSRSFVSFPAAEDFLAGAELKGCDIVLIDINLPGLDGISLTKHIKNVSAGCDVVVMTGEATLDNAMAAIQAGAYDFLTKPFSYERLASTVDRCVEKRRVSRELELIKAAQEELSAAYSQLKAAERMKEAFLSVIGHELRTPLAKILGAVGALEGAVSGEPLRLLLTAAGGARELHRVIETLILYADSQKEPAPEYCREVDLYETAVSVRAGLLPKAAELGVALDVGGAAGPAVIYGEPDWIRLAIEQLALNAIIYNRRGGRAEITVERAADRTSVTVADTGIGIPEELLGGLGNPFYQIADYLTRKTGGLGLGLAIVKRIAEAHNGGVAIKSVPGNGTTFTLTFSNTAPCGKREKSRGC